MTDRRGGLRPCRRPDGAGGGRPAGRCRTSRSSARATRTSARPRTIPRRPDQDRPTPPLPSRPDDTGAGRRTRSGALARRGGDDRDRARCRGLGRSLRRRLVGLGPSSAWGSVSGSALPRPSRSASEWASASTSATAVGGRLRRRRVGFGVGVRGRRRGGCRRRWWRRRRRRDDDPRRVDLGVVAGDPAGGPRAEDVPPRSDRELAGPREDARRRSSPSPSERGRTTCRGP